MLGVSQNQLHQERNVMDTFLHKHAGNVIGVLNGFDRLVFRGALRRLVFLEGMKSYLWAAKVLLKDFGEHVLSVTSLLKKASSELAEKTSRPMKYLPSSGMDKEKVARGIAEQEGILESRVKQSEKPRCS